MRKQKNNFSNNDGVLKDWIDPYNGPAIYALIDENGKAYIGKSNKLQERLLNHRRDMNRIILGLPPHHESAKIIQAVNDGHIFTVKILIKPFEVTHNQLCELEQYFFKLYGGIKETYNSTLPTEPNYWVDSYNKIL